MRSSGKDSPLAKWKSWRRQLASVGVRGAASSEALARKPAKTASARRQRRPTVMTAALRLPDRRVDHRPEMDDPAEQEEPQHSGQHELDERHENPALEKLSQPRDEEAR